MWPSWFSSFLSWIFSSFHLYAFPPHSCAEMKRLRCARHCAGRQDRGGAAAGPLFRRPSHSVGKLVGLRGEFASVTVLRQCSESSSEFCTSPVRRAGWPYPFCRFPAYLFPCPSILLFSLSLHFKPSIPKYLPALTSSACRSPQILKVV